MWVRLENRQTTDHVIPNVIVLNDSIEILDKSIQGSDHLVELASVDSLDLVVIGQ